MIRRGYIFGSYLVAAVGVFLIVWSQGMPTDRAPANASLDFLIQGGDTLATTSLRERSAPSELSNLVAQVRVTYYADEQARVPTRWLVRQSSRTERLKIDVLWSRSQKAPKEGEYSDAEVMEFARGHIAECLEIDVPTIASSGLHLVRRIPYLNNRRHNILLVSGCIGSVLGCLMALAGGLLMTRSSEVDSHSSIAE